MRKRRRFSAIERNLRKVQLARTGERTAAVAAFVMAAVSLAVAVSADHAWNGSKKAGLTAAHQPDDLSFSATCFSICSTTSLSVMIPLSNVSIRKSSAQAAMKRLEYASVLLFTAATPCLPSARVAGVSSKQPMTGTCELKGTVTLISRFPKAGPKMHPRFKSGRRLQFTNKSASLVTRCTER